MKTLFTFRSPIFALALGLFCLTAAHASAQTVITSVPYTITASGRYILGGNLTASSGAAISIQAPNVVLDLDGYYVAGPGNTNTGTSVTDSVILVGDVANVTIRNGTVAGNAYGIFFTSIKAPTSRNYVVDSVTVTRCFLIGIYFDHAAPGSLIKNCTFSTIGGSTLSANSSPRAIASLGGVRIERNNINNITPSGTGTSYGIFGSASDFMIGNTMTNCTVGIANGKYLNNLTSSVTAPFSGGTGATGNN